jgi:predicted ATPase
LSSDAVNQLLSIFARTLKNIFLIPAIRGMDTEDYPLGDSDVSDFGEGASLDTRATRLTTTLAYQRELETILSEWFTRITGLKVRFPLVRKKRVTITGGTHKPQFIMVNEGFGSNQLTFALAQLAISPKDSILCYEEPEIHLHPRAQAELANILVEIAKQDEKQMILTTHSEHILYGLLSNVAEGKLSPDELAIWYFSRENGKVEKPQELKVDEKGRVEGGLRGFFEVELEQLERYFKAFQKEG